MGLAPSGDFACYHTDEALKEVENMMKSVDDALCEDKGMGPQALTDTVEKVLRAFRKYGIIASSKKLVMGHSVEFGDTFITGEADGVKITPNVARIKVIREMRRLRSRKEVQIYLGTVRSLIKWFPDLNISTCNISDSITKGKVFDWSDIMEEEFLEIQRKLGSPEFYHNLTSVGRPSCSQMRRV